MVCGGGEGYAWMSVGGDSIHRKLKTFFKEKRCNPTSHIAQSKESSQQKIDQSITTASNQPKKPTTQQRTHFNGNGFRPENILGSEAEQMLAPPARPAAETTSKMNLKPNLDWSIEWNTQHEEKWGEEVCFKEQWIDKRNIVSEADATNHTQGKKGKRQKCFHIRK